MKAVRDGEDSSAILSDVGDMIGGALVVERKRVEVAAAAAYGGFDPLPTVTPQMPAFAKAEARRLGMLDG